VSVVVPCFNEEAVLEETYRRLAALRARLIARGKITDLSDIVFVDDGSRDQTWRLIESWVRAGATEGSPRTQQPAAGDAYMALKGRMHLKLLEKFDLAALESLAPDMLRQEIAAMVERLLHEEQAMINDAERGSLIRDIQHEMLGFGPLELLMADPTVSDILVNSYRQIYVERKGRLELTNVTFNDEKHLMRIIDKIVSLVGRRIDESSPMVDARLPDGSRAISSRWVGLGEMMLIFMGFRGYAQMLAPAKLLGSCPMISRGRKVWNVGIATAPIEARPAIGEIHW
jgi:hypothetical protein